MPTDMSPAMAPPSVAEEIARTNPYAGRIVALWQAPIEFYGKAVDENSNAVAGAKVSFHWMEMPAEGSSKSAHTESDRQGLFSLHSAHGPSLSVSVSKDGYFVSTSTPSGFRYTLEKDTFHADPQNPVIFYLKKKGHPEPLVTVKRNYRIPRDGTAVSIDLVSGANSTGENGNLVVQCWTSDQEKRAGEKYDWRCLVTIPGGGVISTDEEFPFFAPQTAYRPTAEINMPSDRTDWRDSADLKFYYKLTDGRYGRMTFSMIAHGQHFCMIDSVLNPSGSRNLEPAN